MSSLINKKDKIINNKTSKCSIDRLSYTDINSITNKNL